MKKRFLPSFIPTLKTLTTLFDGVEFSKLPVLFIKSTKNNTLLTCTGPRMIGAKAHRSTGCEGYKNCAKRSAIAAQTTATSLAKVF